MIAPQPPSLHPPLALFFISAKPLTVDDPGTVAYIRRPDQRDVEQQSIGRREGGREGSHTVALRPSSAVVPIDCGPQPWGQDTQEGNDSIIDAAQRGPIVNICFLVHPLPCKNKEVQGEGGRKVMEHLLSSKLDLQILTAHSSTQEEEAIAFSQSILCLKPSWIIRIYKSQLPQYSIDC